MCSEYVAITEKRKIDESLGFTIRNKTGLGDQWEIHVKIYGSAPILVYKNGEFVFEMAQFSLLPPPRRFSTFNARLSDWDYGRSKEVRIYEKPTWKKPFSTRPCIVPMSSFLEPIYFGDHAGKVMQFYEEYDEYLWAAGLYDEVPNPKMPGELYTGFSIIIHSALDFVLKIGHHRSPVFLRPEDAQAYLRESMTVEERYRFLLEKRFVPDLKAIEQRTMVRGWEKRVAENRKAYQEEMDFLRRT
jgi:putative SOS response-associated peptidase YedK